MARRNNRNPLSSFYEGNRSLPPMFSYDPAILAELRARERGVQDAIRDTHRALRFNRQDRRAALADIALNLRRGRQDIRQSRRRGLRDLRFQEQDVRTAAERGRQDLSMRLDDLVRSFNQLGTQQFEAATAAGVTGGGTLGASAAARESNFQTAREPIDVERQRLEEDLNRDLERLGIARQDLRRDSQRAMGQLRQDTRRDRRLTRRQHARTARGLRTDLRRDKREEQIGRLDLIQQAMYQARQTMPGAFNRYRRR